MTNFPSVVVPAVPPKGPQVNLVQSAVQPSGVSDPANPIYELTAQQLAALPDDQRAELAKRQGDSWVRGFTYQPENHKQLQITGACATKEGGKHGPDLIPVENLPIVVVVPPVLVAEDQCTTFGFEEHDFKGRASRLLENGTPEAVEREFWTGIQAEAEGWPNPYLTNHATATVLNAGKETSAVRGLQILQDALAQCGFGGIGYIHCEREACPNLLSCRRIGQDLYDIFDNVIIPGVGYDGTGPIEGGESEEEEKARKEARESWMFATDLVMVRKSQPEIFPDSFAEATDWGQGSEPNTVTFYAERFAVAYFDVACHFAVKVKLPA